MRHKQSLLKEPKNQTTILTRPSKKFKEKFELLICDPSFQKDIKLLRDKLGINLEQSRLIVKERDSFFPLLKKYNLSEDWEYIIGMYISSNEFEEMGDPHGLQIKVAKKKESATLKIYPETTLREIKSAYSTIIKVIKGGKIIRTRTAVKIDRDSYIYELYLKRKSYKEISVLVKENYSEQIDKFELSRIVAKMKKRRSGI